MLSGATVVSLRFWELAPVFHDPHLIQILSASSLEGTSLSGKARLKSSSAFQNSCRVRCPHRFI